MIDPTVTEYNKRQEAVYAVEPVGGMFLPSNMSWLVGSLLSIIFIIKITKNYLIFNFVLK